MVALACGVAKPEMVCPPASSLTVSPAFEDRKVALGSSLTEAMVTLAVSSNELNSLVPPFVVVETFVPAREATLPDVWSHAL